MISYSFLNENFEDYDNEDYDNDDSQIRKRKFRKKWHTPQSRQDARLGSVESFSSITQKPYNNVFNSI